MENDFEKRMEDNPQFKKNVEFYQDIDKKAMKSAEELSLKYVKDIMENSGETSTISVILTLAKTFTYLCSYLYDKEEDFISAVDTARKCVAEELVPMLLDPKPCGHCDSCKNGHPDECEYPVIRGKYIESRFIPIVAGMLVEYDLFNKIVYQEILDENEEEENGRNNGQNAGDTGSAED